jgi:hypothetical protein
MGLNGSPTFIRALADLVLHALAGGDPSRERASKTVGSRQ